MAKSEFKTVARPNILLVEDDVEYSNALVRSLASEYENIEQAQSYEEAINTIRERENYFDVIVLDHGLKGDKTGLDFLKQLRNLNVLAEVIVLTGLGNRQLGVDMLREGAFRYFTKQSENDDELICAIQVAHEYVLSKRSGRYWKRLSASLNNSMLQICGLTTVAMVVVIGLNLVVPENFIPSAVVLVVLLLSLLIGIKGVRNFRMTLKSNKASIELQADSD